MTVDFNLSLLLQAVITALIFGVGRIVYQSSIKLAELNVALVAHTQQDAENFGVLHDEVNALKAAKSRRGHK